MVYNRLRDFLFFLKESSDFHFLRFRSRQFHGTMRSAGFQYATLQGGVPGFATEEPTMQNASVVPAIFDF